MTSGSLSKLVLVSLMGWLTVSMAAQAAADSLPVLEATLTAPPQVPPPVNRDSPALVQVRLETPHYRGALADGVTDDFWAFGHQNHGAVPGPMIRVRTGDTVQLPLANRELVTSRIGSQEGYGDAADYRCLCPARDCA